MRPLFIFLLLTVMAWAAERPGQAEIDYLLTCISSTDCHFIRSGTEYSGKEAADHLRSKLAQAGARVQSVEDFIKGIASKSYLTGRAYQIKTPEGKIVAAEPWLREALARRAKEARTSKIQAR